MSKKLAFSILRNSALAEASSPDKNWRTKGGGKVVENSMLRRRVQKTVREEKIWIF